MGTRALEVPVGVEMDAEGWEKLSGRQKQNRIRVAAWERFHAENAGSPLAPPYMIEHRLDHRLLDGPKRACNEPVEERPGGRCARGKWHPVHWGYPPSYRSVGSGDPLAYQSIKKHWDRLFVDLLEGSGMPKGIGHLMVEGEICISERRDHDQGNLRFFAEKSCGDALVAGGWLLADDWRRFSFGNYELKLDRGSSPWCRFVLFPAWETPGWERFAVGGYPSEGA